MHRADEVDVVHRRGDNVGARVPVGGHGAGQIDEVHQPPAQQVAQHVGVVGQNHLGHLRLCAGHGAGRGVAGTVSTSRDSSSFWLHCKGLRLQCTRPPDTMKLAAAVL